MSTHDILFAGAELSSGRKPVTFTALDETLNIVCLEKMDIDEVIAYLDDARDVSLAINIPSSKTYHPTYLALNKRISQAGLKPYARSSPRQFMETNTQDCFRVWIGKTPLPRRTFEGRIQRALLLYDQGLRINDPMDFFEEITRHHMRNGVFPNELLYSTHELDALAAAYVAWLALNEAGQIEIAGNNLILPREPERD